MAGVRSHATTVVRRGLVGHVFSPQPWVAHFLAGKPRSKDFLCPVAYGHLHSTVNRGRIDDRVRAYFAKTFPAGWLAFVCGIACGCGYRSRRTLHSVRDVAGTSPPAVPIPADERSGCSREFIAIMNPEPENYFVNRSLMTSGGHAA